MRRRKKDTQLPLAEKYVEAKRANRINKRTGIG
jgi:hypothetical protein